MTDVNRFWSNVDRTADASKCWHWRGRTLRGYGKYAGKLAHRIAYELEIGAIPGGLEIDHLCRTPRCVNPSHLEPVTQKENMRRRYAIYTECASGHPFTPENTYIRPTGWRDCRACIRARALAYKARKRAA